MSERGLGRSVLSPVAPVCYDDVVLPFQPAGSRYRRRASGSEDEVTQVAEAAS
jgi:hypothetical protein